MKRFLFPILALLVIAPAAYAGDNKSPPVTGHLNTEGCRLRVGDKRTPSPPADLAAAYDHSSGEIFLVWSQNGDVPVCYWQVYYSLTSGGPYHKLGRADNDGRSQQAFAAPLAVVPPGDTATIYLVVVSFRSNAIFSPESREADLIVDRSQEELPGNDEPPGGQTLPIQNLPVMAQAAQRTGEAR
jgi:hypothetical protein